MCENIRVPPLGLRYGTFQNANIGADQIARMRRPSAPVLFTNPEDRFSRVEAQMGIDN